MCRELARPKTLSNKPDCIDPLGILCLHQMWHHNPPKKLVHMPSTAFGHAVMQAPKEKLIAKYQELYYKEPQNFKQRQSNCFILEMLQEAEWRFSNKRDLMDWGRKERDLSWNVLVSFAILNGITGDTRHFYEQCINYKLAELSKETTLGSC